MADLSTMSEDDKAFLVKIGQETVSAPKPTTTAKKDEE